MYDGEALRYERTNGGDISNVIPVPMAASQVVSAKSGRFVYMNDGAATLCAAASTTIFGWLNTRARTPDTSEEVPCDIDLNGIWRIPINSGTFVVGMRGDYCDLSDSSDIQGAALDSSSRDLLIIVNGDVDNNKWVDVKMNPAVWGTLVGADA